MLLRNVMRGVPKGEDPPAYEMVRPAANTMTPAESANSEGPEDDPEFAATWEFLVERDTLLRAIAKWETIPAPTARDLAARETGVAKARADLAAFDKRGIPNPGGPVLSRTRRDCLSEEIETICEGLPSKPTAQSVMRKLRSCAGLPGSCVSRTTANAVVWIDGRGSPHTLTMAALRKRLQRATVRR